MKKVLYVNDVMFSKVSGELSHTVGILNALVAKGLDITFYTLSGNENILKEYGLSKQVKLVYGRQFNNAKMSRFFYYFKLFGFQLHKYDFIYARESVFSFLLFPSLFLGSCKFVFEYNGIREYEVKSWLLKMFSNISAFIFTPLAKSASMNVAVSNGIEFYLRRKYPNIKLITINNGSSLKRGDEVKLETQLSNCKILTFVGNISTWQNFDYILELAHQNYSFFKEEGLVFHIYGDGKELSRLKVKADNLSVSDLIIFKGGIPNYRLPDVLKEASAGVLIDKRFVNGLPLFSPLKMYEYNLYDLPTLFFTDQDFVPLQESGYYTISNDNIRDISMILSEKHDLSSLSRSWDDVADDFIGSVFN